MIPRVYLLLFLALLVAAVPLHAQWTQVHVSAQSDRDYGWCFLQHEGSLFVGGAFRVHRSNDNGATWSRVELESGNVTALAAHGGYLFAAITDGGPYILRSTDNGLTWSSAAEGLEEFVEALHMVGDTLFAGSYYKGIYRSTDHGDSWHQANTVEDSSAPPPTYVSSFTINNGYLYAGTGLGVYRSSNRGDNWTRLTVPVRGEVNALGIYNDSLIAGQYYSYSSVTLWNREQNEWESIDVDTGNTQWIPHAFLTIGNEILVGGIDDARDLLQFGGLHMLGSDRKTWISLDLNYEIFGLTIVGTDLYAATGNRGIWKLSLSEVLGVEEEVHTQSGPISLHIHPNPALEQTNVNYTLSYPSQVSITIYDALGRIISEPVAGAVQEAGEYQIALPTHNLAAGVYLCSVNAGGIDRAVQFVVVR
jgi:hypothetical protein